jgi:uncharacterized integral membrane protein
MSDPDLAVPVVLEPQSLAGITPTPPVRIARTRFNDAWIAVIVAAAGLVFLLIFILQNLTSASVHFLGTNGTLPTGVAILLAAVGGRCCSPCSARILQLRPQAGHASVGCGRDDASELGLADVRSCIVQSSHALVGADPRTGARSPGKPVAL